MINKTIFAGAAAFALSACGGTSEQAAELRADASAAVEEREVVAAVVSAVDVGAVGAIAEGAARQALREALPAEEMAIAGAIVDERALVEGLGRAVDERAFGQALKGVVETAQAEASSGS